MIVTDSRHPADRDTLDGWTGRERVAWAGTYDEAFDEVRRGSARAFVLDVDEWPPGGACELCNALRVAATQAPIILRTNLTIRALMELPHLAHSDSLRRLRLSFRGHEGLAAHLGSDEADNPGCATFDVLRATLGLIPPRERYVWVATVVVCRRAVRRDVVEGRVAMGKAKLRSMYDRWGLPAFPKLNAALLCAHLLAGADSGGSADVCAAWAGFADARALDSYVVYHFGRRFTELRNEEATAAQVERIAAWFTSR